MKDPTAIFAGEIPAGGGGSHGLGEPSRPVPSSSRDHLEASLGGPMLPQAITSGLQGRQGNTLAVAVETAGGGQLCAEGLPRRRLGDKREASRRALEEEPGRSASFDWPKGHAPPYPSPRLPIGAGPAVHMRRIRRYRPSRPLVSLRAWMQKKGGCW